MKLWTIIVLALAPVVSSAQQQPSGRGTSASGGTSRLFQDAVNEAPDGAVLYADDYGPRTKVGIRLPAWKSLTIVGGVFEADADTRAALSGAYWADRVRLVGCAFLANEFPATVQLDADTTILEGCMVEGPVILNDGAVIETWISLGRAPIEPCGEFYPVPAALAGARLFVAGSLIVGQDGSTRADCTSCGELLAGGPGVYAFALFLDGARPSVALGGLGETSPACPFPAPQGPAMVVLGPILTL